MNTIIKINNQVVYWHNNTFLVIQANSIEKPKTPLLIAKYDTNQYVITPLNLLNNHYKINNILKDNHLNGTPETILLVQMLLDFHHEQYEDTSINDITTWFNQKQINKIIGLLDLEKIFSYYHLVFHDLVKTLKKKGIFDTIE